MMLSNCVSKLRIYAADTTLKKLLKQRNMLSVLGMRFLIQNYML